MEGFAEVENNIITVLCNGAEEGKNIDLSSAQSELERLTTSVDEAETAKEKIDSSIELRKAKARVQALS
jgi:F-type H+-transporting ATPase subunit epsilon